MPAFADKAKRATVLVQRYVQVKTEGEKESCIEHLNSIFPNIRCRHHPKEGMTVFYLEDKVKDLPRALAHTASVILKVGINGQAKVTKNRFGESGQVIPATDLLAELGEAVPRRSVWQRLAEEDDWI